MKNHMKKIINKQFLIMAGPCAAESEKQMLETAKAVKNAGADIFRANFYKPRTSPESFQGCGDVGFKWIKKVKQILNIPVMIEVRTPRHIKKALKNKIDVLWVGTRNSQNYDLLVSLGKLTKKTKTPVLLKRGVGMRFEEWLGASRYITNLGNKNVILCERGIVTFDPKATRNLLDLQTAWLAQKKSGLPVVVDPSHAAGRIDLIEPMSLAVKAAGLSGLLIEVHSNPKKALTDAFQQLNPKQFSKLVKKLKKRS
jgi:3-deoxy-7-phosphoheptulonate synthase